MPWSVFFLPLPFNSRELDGMSMTTGEKTVGNRRPSNLAAVNRRRKQRTARRSLSPKLKRALNLLNRYSTRLPFIALKVLIIGSGAREHALAWKIKQSPQLGELYCAPGNTGTAQLATNVAISANDVEKLADFALAKDIDLTVVGPEEPLVAGIVDRFMEIGRLAVGPTQKAAHLEGSKVFAKNFMKKYGIPSADYETFNQAQNAVSSLKSGRFKFPVVVKADGLAAGKGVFVCSDLSKSLEAIDLVMRQKKFGVAGSNVVVEDFLEGEEASFMALSDGELVFPLAASQDHKAIYDGDRGPNTGGMGAYSSDSILSETQRTQIMEKIITPTVEGMAAEGRRYLGVLYAGLMLTSEGPKVLEFNVRFGDPEAQVVLPRMKGDLLDVLLSLAQHSLRSTHLNWSRDNAVCVVLAAEGYPGPYRKGQEISGLEMAGEEESTVIFHAGTSLKDGNIVTNGGRVLGVAAYAPALESAIMKVYEGVNKIHFEGMYYRRDIASKGLGKETK